MRELNDKNFQKSIQTDCIVDFWAPWCGPCKMQSPILEAADNEHKNIDIFKVNVDDHPQLASDFNVRGIPMLLFFKKGELVDQHAGILDKPSLAKKIQEHFS